MMENGGRQSFSLLNFDTQETKKKVLEGNTSGNLLNLVFREQSAPEQKRPNDLPPLQLWSNMWSKKFRNFGWCESGGKIPDLAPKMQKIKPKTIRFRLYLVRVFITDLNKHMKSKP